jgi:hypothetical protein
MKLHTQTGKIIKVNHPALSDYIPAKPRAEQRKLILEKKKKI